MAEKHHPDELEKTPKRAASSLGLIEIAVGLALGITLGLGLVVLFDGLLDRSGFWIAAIAILGVGALFAFLYHRFMIHSVRPRP
jgi:putative flippase GtrA